MRKLWFAPTPATAARTPTSRAWCRGLTDQQRADLIAFLESLTDETFLTDPRYASPFD